VFKRLLRELLDSNALDGENEIKVSLCFFELTNLRLAFSEFVTLQ